MVADIGIISRLFLMYFLQKSKSSSSVQAMVSQCGKREGEAEARQLPDGAVAQLHEAWSQCYTTTAKGFEYAE